MTENNQPKVFVLIRTRSFICYLNKSLKRAISSVLRQDYGNIKIMILHDHRLWCGVKRYKKLPSSYTKLLKLHNFSQVENSFVDSIYLFKAKFDSAASSLYFLRKELSNKTIRVNNDDIVITLDDDDELLDENVISKIVEKMTVSGYADLCITSYRHYGNKFLDITNGAGRIHSDEVKRISKGGAIIDERSSYLDSLGWTKSYRYSYLKEYLDSIENAIVNLKPNSKRKATKIIKKFFKVNSSYEDFPEVISLSKNKNIVACSIESHLYKKTPSSITSKQKLNDFKIKRANYLSLLLKMVENKAISKPEVVARFIVVKVLLIENILAKFRNDKTSIKWYALLRKWRRWYMRTYSYQGYFYDQLLSLLEKRKQINFFAEKLKKVNDYKEIVNIKDSYSVIKKACEIESDICRVDVQECIREKHLLMEKPINRYLKRFKWLVCILVSLFLILVAIILFFIDIKSESPIDVNKWLDSLAIIVSLITALGTYIGTSYLKYKDRDDKDFEIQKVYRDELNDLIRHLVANLNIMLQMKLFVIKNPKSKPLTIHSINFHFPTDSLIFSEDGMKDMMINSLDNINRVRLNVRNVNNSAAFITDFLSSPSYNSITFLRMLDWEITRYFGYIINFKYVAQDPEFMFPSPNELDRYLYIKGIDKELCDSILGDYSIYYPKMTPESAKEKMVKDYIDKYKSDRREVRKILV